ncbi:MAG: aminopeptidase [Alphaproteobacteria bacterium]|nr:aminopeptidase [Alphaproteobacteria bacterium]
MLDSDNAAPTARLDALLAAERRALDLLEAIERAGLIAPGKSERQIEDEIGALARAGFGVERDWHERLVRAGVNTLATSSDRQPDRIVAEDDMVFVDLGPVFAEWEADVGRSYAVGDDPAKHALCAALPVQFSAIQAHYLGRPGITGAELYAFAVECAERAGWRFAGKIAGHIVGEYNHRDWPGDRQLSRIAPGNPTPMSGPDPYGRERFWILEVHLVSPDGGFGGFYERLIHPATAEP